MSETVKGTITKLNAITGDTAANGRAWRKRSFLLDGDLVGGFINDDNVKVVESLQEGDFVQCDITVSGKWKNFSNLVILNQAAVPAKVQDKPAVEKTNNYQERMNFIGARNTAIRFLKVALANDLITLPTKKDDKLQAFEALVDQYANDLADASWTYEYNNNKGEVDGQEDTGYAE